mgnify:FL=1
MKKQQGFTIIELVIVIVILGLLAASAVPRFLGATDNAQDASVEGVAGGFASAVGLVRAEWELAGRPSGDTNITYDSVSIEVSDNGYPLASPNDDGVDSDGDNMDTDNCQQVFNAIMSQAPTNVAQGSSYGGERYLVNAGADCIYTLAASVEIETDDSVTTGLSDGTVGQGFIYEAESGQITVFKN